MGVGLTVWTGLLGVALCGWGAFLLFAEQRLWAQRTVAVIDILLGATFLLMVAGL